MKIEEAIGDLKYYIEEDPYFNGTYEPVTDFEKYCYNHCKAIDTLINYVETIHKELDRLEGIEDNTEMLKEDLKIAVKQIKDFEKGIDRLKKQKEEYFSECRKKDKVIDEMALSMWRNDWISGIPNNLKAGIECIKEYFYKKAQK